MKDLRFALRLLARHPGFTATAVLSLALGIAATTTVFSWMRSVLLDPLPGVADAGRVVAVESVTPSGTYIDSSWPDYRDIRDRAKSFSGTVAFRDRPLRMGPDDATGRVWALFVSGNYFDVLGVRPAAGRFFDAAEQQERQGAAPVAVIGYGLWQRRFQGDRSVVGRVIRLNRQEITVIGVAPRAFHGTIDGLSYDVFVPVTMERTLSGGWNWMADRGSRPMKILGRLRDGVSIEQANAEVATIAKDLSAAYPENNRDVGGAALSFSRAPYGAQTLLRTPLFALLGLGALVLLIVSANVSSLMLARAVGRQREMAVRLAVGAKPSRLLRQVLTESVLLSFIGGWVGILGAAWMAGGLRYLLPATELPVDVSSSLSPAVLLFALAAAVVAGLLFGAAPALHATRIDVLESLKSERTATAGRRSSWLRGLLVVSELTFAVVALACAGLLLRTFQNARAVDPGFDVHHVLLVGLDLGSTGYDRDKGLDFQRRLQARLTALPGVQAVSYAEDVPLGFDGGSWETLSIDGYVPAAGESMKIYRNLVSPGYFGLMRIPLEAGRDFTVRDDRNASPVAIVNETFARHYFGGDDESAVGRQFETGGVHFTIAGVVGDTKVRSLSEPAAPYFYVPLAQAYGADTGFAVHVRTASDPLAVLPAVRRVIREIDPAVPTDVAIPLAQYTDAALFPRRIAAAFGTTLGAVSLLLAVFGLYGVLSYSVSQRTREIGVRMALGAARRDVVGLVLRHALGLTLTGLAIGLAAALAVGRLLGGLLLGVSPADPATFVLVAAALTLLSLVAAYLPARRAVRVNPIQALRAE